MNKFLAKLERSMGKYAIKNLPLFMIICYGVGYIMQIINPAICYSISLNPYAILHGQVWRLFTWVLMSPSSQNIFFLLITLYFYYSIGSTLERTWGTFYFNYYIFSGLLFTILGAFLFYGYSVFAAGDAITAIDEALFARYGEIPALYGGSWYYAYMSSEFSTYFISMSIFLAFAATFPDVQILLFMIIPVKVKVMGIIYAILLVIEALNMGINGLFVVGASLLNFVIFFVTTRTTFSSGFRKVKRDINKTIKKTMNNEHEKMRSNNSNVITKHKCAICGRTDQSNPELSFRFCSKCNGNYEFCQDHLFSHKHF